MEATFPYGMNWLHTIPIDIPIGRPFGCPLPRDHRPGQGGERVQEEVK